MLKLSVEVHRSPRADLWDKVVMSQIKSNLIIDFNRVGEIIDDRVKIEIWKHIHIK